MDTTQALTFVHYLPILTTVISVAFAAAVYQRYRLRGGGNHLLWWAGGILVYGAGTFAEGWITLFGWNPVIFKFWYIVGALLGGAPLAQGTVWLLLRQRTARRLTIVLLVAVGLSSVFVIASPINYAVVDPHLPSGEAFGWQWVRLFSPFINTYAVIFLIGGAILSAWRFYKASRDAGSTIARDRFIGNVFIAIGAILPGFGGVASRAGHTEILYIMELAGIMLIWTGYWFNVRKRGIGAGAARVADMARASMVVVAVLSAWLVAATAVAQSSSTAQQEAAVETVVQVREPGGSPLSRVVVVLRPANGGDAVRQVTDGQGEARFAGLPPGSYELEARRAGFTSLLRELTVHSGDEAGPVSAVLEFAPVNEEVTVAATRTPRELDMTPGEVSVVDREDIEQWQARALDDVLRFEPGVDVAEAPRRLGQTINIRGFDDQRVLVLRDGARVSQYTSGHRGNLFFDVDDIDTIEVVRGPASALYGSGALGGVISIRTLDPGDLLSGGSQVGAQFNAGYSTAYNEWVTTPRAFGQSDKGIGWLVGYTARQNDGTVRLADAGARLSDAEERINDFNARLVLPASDRDFLRFSVTGYDNDGVTSTNLSDLVVDDSARVDRSTRQITATANWERAGEGWFDEAVHATIYYTDAQIDEARLQDGRLDDIGYRSWGVDVRNTAAIGAAQDLTYGVEVVADRQEATRDGEPHAFFPGGTQNLTGVYAQDEIALAGGRLSLIPGVRWDRWASESADEEIIGQEVSNLTPKLGAAWEMFDGFVATGGYGEGFRAPRFNETFLSGVHFAFPLPGERFFLAVFDANPELLPEESRNLEAGLRYRNGPVSMRASYWHADVDNFIELLPVFTAPFPPPGGTQVEVWQAENVTNATLEGVEASIDWRLQPGLIARANYTNGRGTNRDSGAPLLNAPYEKLVIGTDWSRFDLGTRLAVAARVYGAREEVPELVEPIDAYALFDVSFSWTPSAAPWVTGHVGVNNLADTDHTIALFGTPGTGRDLRFGCTLNLR